MIQTRIQLLMNKYKTVEEKNHKKILEADNTEKQLSRKKTKLTLVLQDPSKSFLRSDDSIVFLRSPKISPLISSSFRSSLYESSLKRLKQQRMNILNETLAPRTKHPIRTNQSLEEQALRRIMKKGKDKKHQYLPLVNRLVEQSLKNRQQSTKNDYASESKQLEKLGFINADINERKSIMEASQANPAFRNLKQKYLELRQLSLCSKRQSHLLEKPEYRRYQNQNQTDTGNNQIRHKMTKQIEEHMNRYNSKRVFQTKISGFKTTIYPGQKSHFKNALQVRHKRKQCQIQKKDHVENFLKRKKHFNQIQPIITENPYQTFRQFSLDRKNKQIEVETDKANINPQRFEKQEDCSPWETDIPNFQRF